MDAASPLDNSASFFRNVSCAYFPCHEGVDPNSFNCLFCYCPLYALGPRCGGNYSYTTSGIKDCSQCTRLHEGDRGVQIVRERFPLLADLARLPQEPTSHSETCPSETEHVPSHDGNA